MKRHILRSFVTIISLVFLQACALTFGEMNTSLKLVIEGPQSSISTQAEGEDRLITPDVDVIEAIFTDPDGNKTTVTATFLDNQNIRRATLKIDLLVLNKAYKLEVTAGRGPDNVLLKATANFVAGNVDTLTLQLLPTLTTPFPSAAYTFETKKSAFFNWTATDQGQYELTAPAGSNLTFFVQDPTGKLLTISNNQFSASANTKYYITVHNPSVSTVTVLLTLEKFVPVVAPVFVSQDFVIQNIFPNAAEVKFTPQASPISPASSTLTPGLDLKSLNYTFAGLESGTSYTFAVQALNGTGTVLQSATATLVAQASATPITLKLTPVNSSPLPTNAFVLAQKSTQVYSFTAPESNTFFVDRSASPSVKLWILDDTKTLVPISVDGKFTAVNAKVYSIWLYNDDVGPQTFTLVLAPFVPVVAPVFVSQDFVIQNIFPNAAEVKFTPQASPISPASSTLTPGLDLKSLNYTFAGLESGTSYTFAVQALNGTGTVLQSATATLVAQASATAITLKLTPVNSAPLSTSTFVLAQKSTQVYSFTAPESNTFFVDRSASPSVKLWILDDTKSLVPISVDGKFTAVNAKVYSIWLYNDDVGPQTFTLVLAPFVPVVAPVFVSQSLNVLNLTPDVTSVAWNITNPVLTGTGTLNYDGLGKLISASATISGLELTTPLTNYILTVKAFNSSGVEILANSRAFDATNSAPVMTIALAPVSVYLLPITSATIGAGSSQFFKWTSTSTDTFELMYAPTNVELSYLDTNGLWAPWPSIPVSIASGMDIYVYAFNPTASPVLSNFAFQVYIPSGTGQPILDLVDPSVPTNVTILKNNGTGTYLPAGTALTLIQSSGVALDLSASAGYSSWTWYFGPDLLSISETLYLTETLLPVNLEFGRHTLTLYATDANGELTMCTVFLDYLEQ